MDDDLEFSHLNDLPKRDASSDTELKAQQAFRNLVERSGCFFMQISDLKDYGTDYQIEVVHNGTHTNVRVHVQLKGTAKAQNQDGSVSVGLARSNLNYLMSQHYSFYACYHVPTDRLLFSSLDNVIARYSHTGAGWVEQDTITVVFSEVLDATALEKIAELARLQSNSSRMQRFRQASAKSTDQSRIAGAALPELYVPDNQERAAELLEGLYYDNKEELISAAAERFAAVLGGAHDAMRFCHMAEINLGMSGMGKPVRITKAVVFLTSLISAERFEQGGLQYSIGNGYSALDKDASALPFYSNALEYLRAADDRELMAQCLKNMGTSYQKLGDHDKAVRCFEDALKFDPQLAEAHHALGVHFNQLGDYQKALFHFENVVFDDGRVAKIASVIGWRVNCHFNLDQGRGAFGAINHLLSYAVGQEWIWPWSARQVASFGRTTVENATSGLKFWGRYLKAHPGDVAANEQVLLTQVFLRMHGVDVGVNYERFREDFEPLISRAAEDQAAFLWDRLGHFAQEDDNMKEAERCFRKAFDLGGPDYGYCLGTALNALNRGAEAIAILVHQAEKVQPDAMSWFQLAIAYEQADQHIESIESYERAIALDEDYELAWFNLGGVFWNLGLASNARRVWSEAIRRFPEHELSARLIAEPEFMSGSPRRQSGPT